ncbi:DUF6685 family protein [Aeromonas veronii]|nr:DUF6685 family protein [Aeromonas hydrophila]
MFTAAAHYVLHQFGYPANLNALLLSHPDIGYAIELPRNTDVDYITRWHQWLPSGWDAKPGELRGRQYAHGEYRGVAIMVGALADLCELVHVEEWRCDIRQVEVLNASRSPLEQFTDLDAFAEARCQGYLDDASPDTILRNLAHGEVRIMQPRSFDYFCYHDWDGRVCLINEGGSHHFATARYLAGVARFPLELKGSLKAYRLNSAAVTALTDEFMLFSITKDPERWLALSDAMQALKATYFVGDLPRPHAGGRVLLLPRRESRSLATAKVLLRAGVPNLGDVLHQLQHQQSGIPGHDK